MRPHGIVYCLTCTPSGKKYVGQTVRTLSQRWESHAAAKGKDTTAIHRAILKYGKENFTREVLCNAASQEELDEREVFWIQTLGTATPDGYNLKGGGSGGRAKYSDESRAKMSQSARAKPSATPEARENMRRAALGKKKSAEHVANATRARQESLAKSGGMSKVAKRNIGEARRALAEKQKANPTCRSPEVCTKIKAACQNRAPLTPESREKIRVALKASWARRKADVVVDDGVGLGVR